MFTEGFWMLATACPQQLWEAVMSENPSTKKGPELPVTDVSWQDARSFIEKLNRMKPGLALDLPSEAQWEYACRAGSVTDHSPDAQREWVHANYERSVDILPVGSLPPNNWGFHEMLGSMGEWCLDEWNGTYDGKLTDELEFKLAVSSVINSTGGRGSSGRGIRLPLPTRALPVAEMARLRGSVGRLALRLIHHDDAVHAAFMPVNREARDVHDALEQVRIEVLGSRRMRRLRADLNAWLVEECEMEGFDRMTRKDQMPLEKALALLAREHLSGDPVPEPARRVVNLWRVRLPEGTTNALAEMKASQSDQRMYASAVRKLLMAFELTEEEEDKEPADLSDQGSEQSYHQGNSDEHEQCIISESDSARGLRPEVMQTEALESPQAWITRDNKVYRAVRGGSWFYWPGFLGHARRFPVDSGRYSASIGFRIAQKRRAFERPLSNV
jgi:hypothetical protein